ncbi:hypothetical protein I3843_01G170700 [Carya illinoinensis]|uniref:EF-hand domain-containing protein n=1 Tax=Carya illinoinensis TaxID=32201 RepID=A0A922G735_CARIL|nr:hypothetical protein I3760_01G173800 [Carya illinoinensis]KAG6732420.1 hypothetical protein I3842_01G176600 [Carya illinoinensis]KAG7996632.1 hypothetical protein I3843_01G170700 [Carya illinoinensis]
MEELHEAAMAYYANAPIELQRLAWNFYLSLDTDGDGQVSFTEYINFLQKSYSWIRPNFFLELDRNQDGSLDFWEVLTLYYAVKTRGGVCCQACQSCLVGLYFTCVTCFESGHKTYDLCPTCYKRKRTNHQHGFFLDNHVLLRSKRGVPSGLINLSQALAPRPAYMLDPPTMGDNGSMAAFQALETGLAMDKPRHNNNANTCSIM